MSEKSDSLLADANKGNATATHTQFDPSRASDASAAAPAVSPPTKNPAQKRKRFRQQIGISENGTMPTHVAKAPRKRNKEQRPSRRGKLKQARTTGLTNPFSSVQTTTPTTPSANGSKG